MTGTTLEDSVMRSDLPDPDHLPYWRPDEWGWAHEPDHPGAPAYRRQACPMTQRPAATPASRGAITATSPSMTRRLAVSEAKASAIGCNWRVQLSPRRV